MRQNNGGLAELSRLVRFALSHLYDHAALQNSPLCSMLDPQGKMDTRSRVHHLRRVLMECIDTLRPERSDQQNARPTASARAHVILTSRYIDGLTMHKIAEELALSHQQVYREHKKGLDAVALLMREHLRQAGEWPASQSRDEHLLVAEAEVDRMTQAARPEAAQAFDILQDVLKLLQPLSRQTRGITISDTAETWPPVISDRTVLRQALINLLTYALNIARADLTLTPICQESALILDIKESTLPDSARPVGEGRRLTELMVARRLVESQGGHMETAPESAPRWFARLFLPSARKATILVVDDNADLIQLFQRYLAGYAVTVAGLTDSTQIIPVAARIQPQLITLDVMMPAQDGWEALQRLRDSPETRHIPVVVCSVLRESRLALSMGASDYIPKPVSQKALLEMLRRQMIILRSVPLASSLRDSGQDSPQQAQHLGQ